MSQSNFRIHPAIGFARVGTAQEFNLAPETLTGLPVGNGPVVGGLPVKVGTDSEPIKASDLRGSGGALARQAARFRVFQYDAGVDTYPMSQPGTEVQIGSRLVVDGQPKTVVDIVWTVHLANKKAAWYGSADDDGILAWGTPEQPTTPKEGLRNPTLGSGPNDPVRWQKLIIDPGPRTISGKSQAPVHFNRATIASWYQPGQGVQTLPRYPKQFPSDAFEPLYPPQVSAIETLGELRTDAQGRLMVVAAYGHANSFDSEQAQYGFLQPVNNDGWFDDTGDGPVNAVLVFDDGSARQVDAGAWVISTDPAYAPQILNVVSLWDDIYDSWVRKLNLRPDLCEDGNFASDYQLSFEDELRPLFAAVGLQRWVTNLTSKAIAGHERVAQITESTKVSTTALAGLGLIRRPPELREGDESTGDRNRMPLALGDSGQSLLSLAQTQYRYLEAWDAGRVASGKRIALNAGETLDKASFMAGLGGRFSPGIDMTYICREPDLYVQNWQTAGTGPFRVSAKSLDYVDGKSPLTLGWTPKRNQNAVEPGDVSKFMAIPWHADYNSCATHLPSPNIQQNNQVYWSWPAQRPVAVYVAKDVKDGQGLLEITERDADGNPIAARQRQRYAVRGPGTVTNDIAEVGRYQPSNDPAHSAGIRRILDHWMDIGVVIQGSAIDDGGRYDPEHFLEVQSQLDDEPSNPVVPWDMSRVPPHRS